MNYADIKYCDVANGLGVRVSVFVSGCTHHCKNCFNEVAWDFKVRSTYPGKDIWCFTGYDFEKDILGHMCKEWPETMELLSYLDVLVDGKFVEELKDLTLRFKGSSNQRTILVQPSLKEGRVVLWDPSKDTLEPLEQ